MGHADFCRMKKAIGVIILAVGVFIGVENLISHKQVTTTERTQRWASAAILLAFGLALSSSKKKEA
jgi:hypothetical protein